MIDGKDYEDHRPLIGMPRTEMSCIRLAIVAAAAASEMGANINLLTAITTRPDENL